MAFNIIGASPGGSSAGKKAVSLSKRRAEQQVIQGINNHVKKIKSGGSGGSSKKSGGGGGSYAYRGGTGGGGGGSYTPPAPPAPPKPPSVNDYLKGDATYQATLSALAKQIQSLQSDIDAQRKERKIDYDKALKDLGYISPVEEGADPTWNWDDTLTAAGRSYQNLLNDFASRGNLQSSAYADSLNDLTRSLMDQYTGINDSHTQFNTDLDRQLTRAKEENTAAQQAARAEAIMRRAAQYGLGV